jgi:hypothetical protein
MSTSKKVGDSSPNSPDDGAPRTVVVECVISGITEIPKPRKEEEPTLR